MAFKRLLALIQLFAWVFNCWQGVTLLPNYADCVYISTLL